MTRSAGAWGQAAAVAAFVSCQLLAHLALVEEAGGALRLALLLMPLIALTYWTLAHATNKLAWLAVLIAAAVVTGALEQARAGTWGLALLYGAPHAAAYLALLWLFGRTLLRGRDALVTRVARRVHGAITPEIEAYTRAVTLAWCLFFAGQVAVSALLFAFAPLEAWSLFVNVLNVPLLVLMFGAEYLYRVTRYPNHPRTTIPGMLRAFAKDASGTASGAAR